jgi:NADH dehydrogenase FAD-containing subunit
MYLGMIFTTDQGNKFTADMAFLCTGVKSNSDILTKNFGDHINSNGFIDVLNTLQLKNHPNIFLAGIKVIDIQKL